MLIETYLSTSYHPDREFIDGELLERTVGLKRHGLAQAQTAVWFGARKETLRLQPLLSMWMQISSSRIRVADLVLCELPLPDEEVFTTPPYLCIEIMSPDDTIAAMQDRLDDYLAFGLPNIWVVDPWKRRGWIVTASGWAAALDLILRTADGRVAMPLTDVLL